MQRSEEKLKTGLLTTQRPVMMVLYTNGNVMVYDHDDKPIEHLQAKLNCYSKDPDVARRVANESRSFFIAQWTGWVQQISRFEMKALLGILTEEDEKDPMAGGTLR
jgi:hypothetical protein